MQMNHALVEAVVVVILLALCPEIGCAQKTLGSISDKIRT